MQTVIPLEIRHNGLRERYIQASGTAGVAGPTAGVKIGQTSRKSSDPAIQGGLQCVLRKRVRDVAVGETLKPFS